MIVWNWLIWSALKRIDSDKYLFFASWVSNSKNCSEEDCLREITLLKKYINTANKKLIYFSSCSIYDTSLSQEEYIKHKLNIENIIKTESSNYLIVRIWNIVWNWWNWKTIMNFLHNSIINNNTINIWKWAKRNLLDADDLVRMIELYLKNGDKNRIIDINNPDAYSILEIIEAFEKQIWDKWTYTILDKWEWIEFDKHISEKLFNQLSIDKENYLNNIIKKYYTWNK